MIPGGLHTTLFLHAVRTAAKHDLDNGTGTKAYKATHMRGAGTTGTAGKICRQAGTLAVRDT